MEGNNLKRKACEDRQELHEQLSKVPRLGTRDQTITGMRGMAAIHPFKTEFSVGFAFAMLKAGIGAAKVDEILSDRRLSDQAGFSSFAQMMYKIHQYPGHLFNQEIAMQFENNPNAFTR